MVILLVLLNTITNLAPYDYSQCTSECTCRSTQHTDIYIYIYIYMYIFIWHMYNAYIYIYIMVVIIISYIMCVIIMLYVMAAYERSPTRSQATSGRWNDRRHSQSGCYLLVAWPAGRPDCHATESSRPARRVLKKQYLRVCVCVCVELLLCVCCIELLFRRMLVHLLVCAILFSCCKYVDLLHWCYSCVMLEALSLHIICYDII